MLRVRALAEPRALGKYGQPPFVVDCHSDKFILNAWSDSSLSQGDAGTSEILS